VSSRAGERRERRWSGNDGPSPPLRGPSPRCGGERGNKSRHSRDLKCSPSPRGSGEKVAEGRMRGRGKSTSLEAAEAAERRRTARDPPHSRGGGGFLAALHPSGVPPARNDSVRRRTAGSQPAGATAPSRRLTEPNAPASPVPLRRRSSRVPRRRAGLTDGRAGLRSRRSSSRLPDLSRRSRPLSLPRRSSSGSCRALR
jgi:hypothetical protein